MRDDTPKPLVAYQDVCDELEAIGFKLVSDATYRHFARKPFYNSEKFRCYILKVTGGYIHVGVAMSRVRDVNNEPRVKLAVTLAEDDLIYSVPNFYAHPFPYDAVAIAHVWLKEATHNFTSVRSNVNFIAGRQSNQQARTKIKTRAWFATIKARLMSVFSF